MTMDTLANTLHIRRAEHRVTQRDAAKALGIGLTRYWEIEKGYTEPTDAERAALCALFGTDDAVIWPNSPAVIAATTSGRATGGDTTDGGG